MGAFANSSACWEIEFPFPKFKPPHLGLIPNFAEILDGYIFHNHDTNNRRSYLPNSIGVLLNFDFL